MSRDWRERVAPDENGCLVWTGYRDACGYGRWTVARKWAGTSLAHRVVYMAEIGPIPEGLTIDHLCGNRGCVNPVHLEAVTIAENVLRGKSFVAANAAKTHCVNGHEFTPENTQWRRSSRRRASGAIWTGTARVCVECKTLRRPGPSSQSPRCIP